MITNLKSETPVVYLADPSRKQKSIQLHVKLDGMEAPKILNFKLPTESSHVGESVQLKVESWKLKVESWKLKIESWKLKMFFVF